MQLTLNCELESALRDAAARSGTTPEALAVAALRQHFLPAYPPIEPRDDWERNLLAIGKPYSANLSNEALSSEGLYD